jgi:translocation and assembly module TamB
VKHLKIPHSSLFSWRKPFFLLLAGGGLLLATMMAFLLLLPALLSSVFMQQVLQSRLETALGRQVTWEKLEFSWRQGVRLTELYLDEGPAPLRRLRLKELKTSFGMGRSEIRPLRVFLNLRLSGLTAAVEPSPATVHPQPAKAEINPEEILAHLATRLREAIDLSWEMPVDVGFMIDAGPVAVHYRDPSNGETAAVEELHFALTLPSLLSAPINAISTAKLTANDGHFLSSFGFSADISNLAGTGGRLRPAGAAVNLQADFPGFSAQLRGAMAEAGLTGEMRLDPAQLLPAIQPFLTEPLPRVTGILSATLESEIADAGDLFLRLKIQGEALTATGGPLANGRAGPLSFTLSQQAATDNLRDSVSLTAGKLLVPEILEAHWEAAVEHPLSPHRRLTGTLGPVTVELAALLELAKPFLPADLPLTSVSGRLECASLAFSAADDGQEGEISLQGLRLLLDRFAARLPAGEVAARDLRLEVAKASFPLAEGFPRSANFVTAWQLGALQVQGEQPLSLAGLAGHADLSIAELRQQPASRFGISAGLAMEQHLSLSSLRLPGVIELSGIEEKLQVRVHADARGDLNVDLSSFALQAQGRPTVQEIPQPVFAVDLQAQGAKVRLMAGETLPWVKNLHLRLQLDPGVHLVSLTEVAPEQGGAVRSEGRLVLDVAALAAWPKALLPPGVGGEGLVDFAWQAGIKLPGPGFADPAVINPLQQARQAFDLLTAAELTLNIKDGALLLGELSPVGARGINTPTPLRLKVLDGAQFASLELVGTVDQLTGLPGAAASFPPQQVRLALQGEKRNLTTAHLTEELRIEPAGLTQVAELVVEKLDRLAELPGALTPADLLRHLNASLFATFDLKLPKELPAGAAPMQLAGDLAAGLRVDLEGGNQLRVGVSGDLSDFGAQLPAGPEIDGLDLRLVFNRLFHIGDRRQVIPSRPWLSETVLDREPAALTMAAPLVAERLWQDLRGASGRERSLTFNRVRAQVAGLPVELRAGEGALQLDGLNPGFNYLQMELLGGSLKARAGLNLTAAVPRVELLCAFSNLDTSRLLPETMVEQRGGAAEITGELALQLPLLDDSRQLLENLDLRLHFWQIGSRTLERALFAFDPYEQNETIIEQRKMLRLGSLRRLRVIAADGSLSTAGEIVAGGVGIELPRLERLNLARLPLETTLAEPLKSLPLLLSFLDLAAANYLELGADGAIIPRRTPMGDLP